MSDILDNSKINVNKIKLVFAYTDVRKIIYDSCFLIDTQCESKGLKLRVYIDEDVPEVFKTDQNRLTQILMNLLSNALKFTEIGYIKITAKMKDKSEGLLTISVIDSGIGIKMDDISDLFQEYGKLDLENNTVGCGLGLNLSQKIAKELGKEGDIDCGIKVKSQLNKGTNFSFTIHDKKEKSDNETEYSLFNDKNSQNNKKLTNLNDKILFHQNSSENFLKKGKKIDKKLTKYVTKNYSQEDFCFSIDEGSKEDASKYMTEKNFGIYTEENNEIPEDERRLFKISSARSLLSEMKNVEYFDIEDVKILIIHNNDSDKDFNYINSDLKDLAYDTAFSVDSAIKKINLANKTDQSMKLIMIDSSIPIIDAFTINEKLNNHMVMKNIPNIPIIGITEIVDRETLKKYAEIGINDILQKPVKKNQILNIIKKFRSNY